LVVALAGSQASPRLIRLTGGVSQASDERSRILVVDDEEYLTDLLVTSLRFQGFEVAIAGNGRSLVRERQEWAGRLRAARASMVEVSSGPAAMDHGRLRRVASASKERLDALSRLFVVILELWASRVARLDG
jgi:CheY-like chemotaxis protein